MSLTRWLHFDTKSIYGRREKKRNDESSFLTTFNYRNEKEKKLKQKKWLLFIVFDKKKGYEL